MISRILNFQIYYGWKKWRQKMIATFLWTHFLIALPSHCASVIAFPSSWIILSHFEKEILISSY